MLLLIVEADASSFFSLAGKADFDVEASEEGCGCRFDNSSCSFFNFACSAAFLAASSLLTCHILTFGGPDGVFDCSEIVDTDSFSLLFWVSSWLPFADGWVVLDSAVPGSVREDDCVRIRLRVALSPSRFKSASPQPESAEVGTLDLPVAEEVVEIGTAAALFSLTADPFDEFLVFLCCDCMGEEGEFEVLPGALTESACDDDVADTAEEAGRPLLAREFGA